MKRLVPAANAGHREVDASTIHVHLVPLGVHELSEIVSRNSKCTIVPLLLFQFCRFRVRTGEEGTRASEIRGGTSMREFRGLDGTKREPTGRAS